MFLKNSAGEKSLSHTLVVLTFVIVMVKVLVGGAALEIGSFSYVFGSIGADEIAALLGTTLGTYAFRRHTTQKFAEVKPEAKTGSGFVQE